MEQMKFAEEIEKLQTKFKGWENDCEKLEMLKKSNEQLIQSLRKEQKQKEVYYSEEIQNYKERHCEDKKTIKDAMRERENFISEIEELERLVREQLQVRKGDNGQLGRELEETKQALQREKHQYQQLKEGMTKSMEKLMRDKNIIQSDYQEAKH